MTSFNITEMSNEITSPNTANDDMLTPLSVESNDLKVQSPLTSGKSKTGEKNMSTYQKRMRDMRKKIKYSGTGQIVLFDDRH